MESDEDLQTYEQVSFKNKSLSGSPQLELFPHLVVSFNKLNPVMSALNYINLRFSSVICSNRLQLK
jgi:hypothetical protein